MTLKTHLQEVLILPEFLKSPRSRKTPTILLCVFFGGGGEDVIKKIIRRKLIFNFCPQNSMLGSSLCKNYQAKTSGKESYETAGNVAGLLFIFCL